MAMKVKPEEEDDVPEGRPLSLKKMQQALLAHLFYPLPPVEVKGLHLVPKADPQPVQPPAEERSLPSAPAPLPAKAPPNNVVPFKAREVAAANDDTPVRPRKRGRKGGGGSKHNGGCQDQDLELKAWLAAFNPIPNNVCLLENKEQHIAASERSARVRLVQYGDPQYRPEPPVWSPRLTTDGWGGHRPPTLEQLYTYSRNMAKRLPEYEIDEQTLLFLIDNEGKTLRAPHCNDPHDWEHVAEVRLKGPNFATPPDWELAIESDRYLTITPAFLESILPQGEVQSKPAVQEAALQVATAIEDLPPIKCCNTWPVPVVLKRGIPFKTQTYGFSATFESERKRMAREVEVQLWATPYKDVTVYVLEDELRDCLQKILEYEAKGYTFKPAITPTEPTPALATKGMSTEDHIKYNAWLVSRSRTNEDLGTTTARQPHAFSRHVPLNDDEYCYKDWLLVAYFYGDQEEPETMFEKKQRWALREQDRLTNWYLEHPNAPEVKQRVAMSPGDVRWNAYVMFFDKYARGEISLEYLQGRAKAIWATYWGDETPTKIVCGEEFTRWAALMEDEIAPIPDLEDSWIIPPDEINKLSSESKTPVTIDHADIVDRLATNSFNRVKHMSLKRGWKNLTGKFKKPKKSAFVGPPERPSLSAMYK